MERSSASFRIDREIERKKRESSKWAKGNRDRKGRVKKEKRNRERRGEKERDITEAKGE